MRSFRALETRSAVLIYGGLILLSVISDWFYRGNPIGAWQAFGSPRHFSSWIFAFTFLGIYTVVMIFTTSFTRWGLEIERVLQQVLSPLSYFQILMLAIVSGVVEEWFFRGVLLPHFGLFISSVAFALMHFLPGGKLWTWSVCSFFTGLALGLIFQSSQSLFLVAMIHTGINLFVLLKINQSAHRAATSSGF